MGDVPAVSTKSNENIWMSSSFEPFLIVYLCTVFTAMDMEMSKVYTYEYFIGKNYIDIQRGVYSMIKWHKKLKKNKFTLSIPNNRKTFCDNIKSNQK